MNHPEHLEEAAALTQDLIEQTDFDETTLLLPTPCRDFDVAALVEHIIGTHHFLLGAAGGSAPHAGAISERHLAVAKEAVTVWSTRGTVGTIDLGGHQLPAEFGLTLHSFEAFVHGWDLATALGRPYPAPDDLVELAWDAAKMIVSEDNRSSEPGAPYAPEVGVAVNASRLDALIAFTGRAA